MRTELPGNESKPWKPVVKRIVGVDDVDRCLRRRRRHFRLTQVHLAHVDQTLSAREQSEQPNASITIPGIIKNNVQCDEELTSIVIMGDSIPGYRLTL